MHDDEITVPENLLAKGFLPEDIRAGIAAGAQFTATDGVRKNGYQFSWAHPVRGSRNAVIETGFFWQSMYIDTINSYHASSLNTPEGIAEIRRFRAPYAATTALLDGSAPESKYGQDRQDILWEGVVLPLQLPYDRSTQAAGGADAYHDFVRRACEHYGRDLLLKVHPLLNEKFLELPRRFAEANGCTLARTNFSCLKYCRFCLLFCSTFAIDCFLRYVPVVQVAPGYWHLTGAVTYADGDVTRRPGPGALAMANQLVDFLAWRYCFAFKMPAEKWIAMLRHYATTDELFPMREEWSYMRNLEHRDREVKFLL